MDREVASNTQILETPNLAVYSTSLLYTEHLRHFQCLHPLVAQNERIPVGGDNVNLQLGGSMVAF